MAVTVFVISEQVVAEVGAGSPATPSLLTLRAVMPPLSHQYLAIKRREGSSENKDLAHLHGEGAKYSE